MLENILILIFTIYGFFTYYRIYQTKGRFWSYFFFFLILSAQFTFIHNFFKYEGDMETYTEKISYPELYYERCGKVTKKLEGFENHGKNNNSEYKEYLVIKFNDGKSERIEVTRNTYDKYENGDGICFATETEYYKLYNFIMGLSFIVGFIGIIIFIGFIYDGFDS